MTDSFQTSLDELAKLFPMQYETAEQIQRFLDQKEYEIKKQTYMMQCYKQKLEKWRKEFEKKKKECRRVDAELSIIQPMLSGMPSSVYETFNKRVQELEYQKVSNEYWLEKNNPDKMNDEFIKYHATKTLIRYLKAIGQKLCEWFITGEVGPGSVSFMKKEYKAYKKEEKN